MMLNADIAIVATCSGFLFVALALCTIDDLTPRQLAMAYVAGATLCTIIKFFT